MQPVSAVERKPGLCLQLCRHALAPHIAGITAGSFRRSFVTTWDNMKRVDTSQRPLHIVNSL
jgi:phosphoglycerate dehydrogenase-like enzyme